MFADDGEVDLRYWRVDGRGGEGVEVGLGLGGRGEGREEGGGVEEGGGCAERDGGIGVGAVGGGGAGVVLGAAAEGDVGEGSGWGGEGLRALGRLEGMVFWVGWGGCQVPAVRTGA